MGILIPGLGTLSDGVTVWRGWHDRIPLIFLERCATGNFGGFAGQRLISSISRGIATALQHSKTAQQQRVIRYMTADTRNMILNSDGSLMQRELDR